MNNNTIEIFQELTLKGLLETQEYIKRVHLNIQIGVKDDELLQRIKSFRELLASDLVKIFEPIQNGYQAKEINEFFEDVDFEDVYEKFLIYFDKEIEGIVN